MLQKTCWLLIAVALSCGPVFAGIYRHDVPVEKYRELAKQKQFDPVGQLMRDGQSIGSAVAISPDWALTAAHVFGKSPEPGVKFMIGGRTLNVVEVIIHPNAGNKDLNLYTDLALVRFDKKYSGSIAALYDKEAEVGSMATIVGYGRTRGAFEPDAAAGERLAGQNMIDVVGSAGNPVNFLGADLDSPTDAASSTFGDKKPLALEYIADGGDSGGGVFIQKDGKWFLAASVSRSVHITERLMKFKEFGFYGSQSYFTRVSPYRDWIKAETRNKNS